jgi:hypothetical protein
MYALFDGDKQIGKPFPTEMQVWEHAVKEGLVEDIPVADEAGGRVLPRGYHVAKIEEQTRRP